jgi:sensor histidine kinase YesM
MDDVVSVNTAILVSSKRGVSGWTMLYWALQLFVWGFFCWWQVGGEVVFASVPWSSAALVWGSFSLAGIVLTHWLRIASKRGAWLSRPSLALIRRLLLTALMLGLIGLAVLVTASMIAYRNPVPAMMQYFYDRLPLWNRIFNEFLISFFVYLTWVAAYFSVATIRHRYQLELKQAQLAEALQAAELRLLEAQLNPHFLFNALNGVRALIAEEPARAQDAVTQLARILRYTLGAGRQQLVSLGQELEMVDDYLALESMRFAERLKIVWEIDRAAAQMRIPAMLLQTLVENAIKHGIAPLRQGGTLRIVTRTTGAELVLEVENPKPPGSADQTIGGLGLRNASKRLQLLFGPHATVELDLSAHDRAKAVVRIPA